MALVYKHITEKLKQGNKLFAVLIDPDTYVQKEKLEEVIYYINKYKVDLIFVGGSIITSGNISETVGKLKEKCFVPVVLFPGSHQQVTPEADAILFLSLISGRNPEYLIGNQVLAAPYIKQIGLETIATGYILVDSGKPTTVSYVSNTTPIPYDKIDIAVATAVAGEMMGMKLIYLEGGSGANKSVSETMIKEVKKNLNIPLIVGGGIVNKDDAMAKLKAGADILVVGNAIEREPAIIKELSENIHLFNKAFL